MSQLVTVAIYYEFPAAHCARSFLEAYGIPCFFQDDQLIGQNWHYFQLLRGIKLHCHEAQHEEARARLLSCEAVAQVETPAETFWRRKYMNGLAALVLAFAMASTALPFVPFWMRKRHWLQDRVDRRIDR